MNDKSEQILGKLEKVDLKTIWENEAYNFMPWLAQKENLELLVMLLDLS